MIPTRRPSTRQGLRGPVGFVVALLVATTAVLRPDGSAPAAGHDTSNAYVTRSGSQLLLAGQPYVFSGINLYNANSDGYCREALSDTDLGHALDQIGLGTTAPVPGPQPSPEPSPMLVDGHGVIRAWFFQTLAANKTTGARDWTRFDRTLQIARDKGYKVIATLTDQWGECGTDTTPTYGYKSEAWYTGGYLAPDPGMAGGYPGWLSYRAWVEQVVTRYANDPTIMAWQLINEAEVNPNGAFQPCPPGDATRDTLIAWATDVSSLVRGLDANHLISLGTIGSGQCGSQGSQFQDVHALATIDLCEVHDYSANGAIPGDPWNGFGVRLGQCAALDKPVIVGEAGIRPSDVGGTLEDRALAFRAKLIAQREVGVDGFVAWDYFQGGSTLGDYDIGPGDPALLELRTPGSTFVVNAPDDPLPGICDPAHCSLREAIIEANTTSGRDLIAFNLPGAGFHVIAPTTGLPAIGDGTFVDGTTQPGTAGSPLVVLNGSTAGAGVAGLTLDGPKVWVRGLRITGFGGAGILATGAGVRIDGNRIDGNGADGVTTLPPAEHVTITANSIAGNGDLAIDVGDDGPTLNQVGGPVGPPPPPEPFRQNRPDLASADPASDRITGSIGSLPGAYRIELFRVAGCDPSFHGEGDTPVGAIDVVIPGAGSFASQSFDFEVAGGITDGQIFTATATNPAGTTSELSSCVIAQSPGAQTYVVTSTAAGFDLLCDADCTFLDAYAGAFFNPGPDTIAFAIPGTGPHVLRPPLDLALEDGLVIDGTTQPGYIDAPLIVIDGSAAGPGNGLLLEAGTSVRGIAIGGYDDAPFNAAVILAGNGATIEASYVGVAPDGVTPIPNSIGVLVDGAGQAQIGGRDLGEGNVISGNGVGIQVEGAGSVNAAIEGNLIGTSATGTSAVSNDVGIRFLGVSGGWIGGSQSGAGNLISGNASIGIELGLDTQAVQVVGNRVGTDATGLVALGNTVGVHVSTGAAAGSIEPNMIGEIGAGNVIAGNDLAGVLFTATSRPATVLYANIIGLGADGVTPIPNGVGVQAGAGTTLAWINDGSPPTANVIAGNLGAGVLVIDGAIGVIVGVNEIRDNGGLGIDLGDDGVSANDPLDADGGDNRGQNAPVLEIADTEGGLTTVDGTLDTYADGTFVLFVYASPTCDPSGFGEATTFLGLIDVTTDGAGHATFSASVDGAPAGAAITATALALYAGSSNLIDFDADSSEFSACVAATGSAATPVGPSTEVVIPGPAGPISLTFDNVGGAGVTTVDVLTVPPPLPLGFQFGDPPATYEIATTAVFSGLVEVCITYDDNAFVDESGARLLHYADPPGAWQDITTSLNLATNVLCGLTSTLSPFAAVERAYVFEGFTAPVDPTPTVNRVKAGSAVPVKFSLEGGNLGLDIFAAGSPSSSPMTCGSTSFDSVEQTVSAGSSHLTYDPVKDLYTYVWKTDKKWSGCRRLVLTFRDGTTATAWFHFQK